jgi:uncharacterized Zn-binding protein involved in type VI secretion
MAHGKEWDVYDEEIKKAVDEVNARFKKTPGYKALNWKLVKAILWTEVRGGPTTDGWKNRPMQMGNEFGGKRDPGWLYLSETLTGKLLKKDPNYKDKVRVIAPADLKTQMDQFGKDDPATNIRAGVYWLAYKIARVEQVSVDDSTEVITYYLKPGQNPDSVKESLGTTAEAIRHDNPGWNPNSLTSFNYHKAHPEWKVTGWRLTPDKTKDPWEDAVRIYNGGGDVDYMDHFHGFLEELEPAPKKLPPKSEGGEAAAVVVAAAGFGPFAARVSDQHECPDETPQPHIGGPILPPGATTVLINFLPAARVTDLAACDAPPDMIAMGSPTVFIEFLPAARVSDPTIHGGMIVEGSTDVMIGDAPSGAPGLGGGGMDGGGESGVA